MNDFLGKPIHGDITHYTERVSEQHDPAELVRALDALCALDHVESIRWEQFTPYFNDGEPCVFRIQELTIKLDVSHGDGDYEDGFLWEYELYEQGEGATWKERKENIIFQYRGIDTTDIFNSMNDLNNMMQHHKVIMQEKFGDPAQVTYDGETFHTEYYDHD